MFKICSCGEDELIPWGPQHIQPLTMPTGKLWTLDHRNKKSSREWDDGSFIIEWKDEQFVRG